MLSKDTINQMVNALKLMRKAKQIEETLYCKEIVNAAHEFVKIAEFDEARDLIMRLPRHFLEHDHMTELTTDVEYCEKSYLVAKALRENPGHEVEVSITMPGGNA